MVRQELGIHEDTDTVSDFNNGKRAPNLDWAPGKEEGSRAGVDLFKVKSSRLEAVTASYVVIIRLDSSLTPLS